MGFIRQRAKLRESMTEAHMVGEINEVIRMGILCAQLGLTEDDIPKMARVYLMLQAAPVESDTWIERTMRAIRMARRGD